MATATTSRKSEESRSEGAQKERPVWTQGFPVTVAVFEFEGVKKDVPPNFRVGVTEAFRRNENSEYEYSAYLSGGSGNLLRAAKLLDEADTYIQLRRKKFYESRKAERDHVENGDGF